MIPRPAVGSIAARIGRLRGALAGLSPNRSRLLVIALAAIAAGLTTPWGLPLDWDAGTFLTVAGRLLDGEVLYRDVMVGKPPGVIVISSLALALARLGDLDPALALRLVYAAVATLGGVAAAALGRSLPARLAGAGLSAFLLASFYWAGGGGLSEPPAFALGLCALALARRPSPPNAALAGALAVAAFGTSFLAAGLALGAGLTVAASSERRARTLAGAAGALAAGVAILGPLWTTGALAGAGEMLAYNRALSSVSCAVRSGWPCAVAEEAIAPALVGFAILVALALTGALLSARDEPLGRRLAVAAGIAATIALAAANLRRFPLQHYLLPILLVDLVAALIALPALRALRGGRARPLVPGVAILTIALATVGVGSELSRADAYAPPVVEGAARLARLPAGTGVFIWGRSPLPALLSGQPTIGRHLHIFELLLPGYASAARYEVYCRELVAGRPTILELDRMLAPDDQMPNGLDPAWIAPLRRAIAAGWERADEASPRLWVPSATRLDPSVCALPDQG